MDGVTFTKLRIERKKKSIRSRVDKQREVYPFDWDYTLFSFGFGESGKRNADRVQTVHSEAAGEAAFLFCRKAS